jgi:hypothetical protein
MSYQIGVANLLVVFVVVFYLFLEKMDRSTKKLFIFFFLWIILCVFLMLRPSQLLWEIIPLLSYAQFPWRYLSLIVILCSFLAGGVVSVSRRNKLISFSLLLLLLSTTFSYTKIPFVHQRDDAYYLSRSNFIDGTNSPGNYFNTIWFDRSLPKSRERFVGLNGVKFSVEKLSATDFLLQLDDKQPSTILMNVAYFPSWVAFAGRKAVPLEREKHGRIYLHAKGKKIVRVVLAETLVESIATTISSVALVYLIVYTLKSIHVRMLKDYQKINFE